MRLIRPRGTLSISIALGQGSHGHREGIRMDLLVLALILLLAALTAGLIRLCEKV